MTEAKDGLPWACEETLVELEGELARGFARGGTAVPTCLVLEIRRLQAEARRLRGERERLFEWAVDLEQIIETDLNRNHYLPKVEAVSRVLKAMRTGDSGCPEALAALAEHDAKAAAPAEAR